MKTASPIKSNGLDRNTDYFAAQSWETIVSICRDAKSPPLYGFCLRFCDFLSFTIYFMGRGKSPQKREVLIWQSSGNIAFIFSFPRNSNHSRRLFHSQRFRIQTKKNFAFSLYTIDVLFTCERSANTPGAAKTAISCLFGIDKNFFEIHYKTIAGGPKVSPLYSQFPRSLPFVHDYRG